MSRRECKVAMGVFMEVFTLWLVLPKELPVRLSQCSIPCRNNTNPISLPLGLFLLMPNLNDLTFLAAGNFTIKYRSRAGFQMELTAREQQMALFAGLEKLHLLLEEMLIRAQLGIQGEPYPIPRTMAMCT